MNPTDNGYMMLVRGYAPALGDYTEIGFHIYAPGAMGAVRRAFELTKSFGLQDKTLLSLELVEEDGE